MVSLHIKGDLFGWKGILCRFCACKSVKMQADWHDTSNHNTVSHNLTFTLLKRISAMDARTTYARHVKYIALTFSKQHGLTYEMNAIVCGRTKYVNVFKR